MCPHVISHVAIASTASRRKSHGDGSAAAVCIPPAPGAATCSHGTASRSLYPCALSVASC